MENASDQEGLPPGIDKRLYPTDDYRYSFEILYYSGNVCVLFYKNTLPPCISPDFLILANLRYPSFSEAK